MTRRTAEKDGPATPGALVQRSFRRRFGGDPEVVARAPGRVNLIGDHTDYNDGFVLPMTLGQAVYLALRRRADDRVRLYALNYDEAMDRRLGALPGQGASWRHYVAGVIQALQDRGLALSGIEGVVYGDVPVGAGLSSSAALEVATLVTLQALFGFAMDGVEAAQLCQQVEHRYVGVQCGIMDQFAARMGRSGRALFLDCRTLVYEEVPVALGERCFVVVDSRVGRSLAGSKYNERRGECTEGVAYFRRYDPGIRALRDVSEDLLTAHAADLPAPVYKRCRHVVRENARVQEAARALRAGDMDRFGALMNASHASLCDLYEVSSAELDLLVEVAQKTEGVLGARMTGAGFGGCTVTLAHQDAVPRLEERLRIRYRETFDRAPAIYVVEENLEAGSIYP